MSFRRRRLLLRGSCASSRTIDVGENIGDKTQNLSVILCRILEGGDTKMDCLPCFLRGGGLVRAARLTDDRAVSHDFRPEGPGGDRLRADEGEAPERAGLAAGISRVLAQVIILLFFGPAIAILFYAVVPPPATPLMLI